MKDKQFDILVAGAGLSGAVIAEQFASQSNKKVLVVEKRHHIGGNCYDYIDENGILINQYGAHLFHTNSETVWTYIQSFAEWENWEHRVLGNVDGKLVPIPVNINTVNILCGTDISTKEEMNKWLASVQISYDTIDDSEKTAKSRVGEFLYDKIFRHYTFKQWNKYPEELDPSVLARIPVRNNFNDRYFDDRYQALPQKGYTEFIQNILSHPNITVRTDTDFFQVRETVNCNMVVYTGPIDEYFRDHGLEKLEYRSIDFIIERYKDMNYYQPNSVINYPGKEVPYTRIVEYKHFLNQQSPHTTIVKEITKDEGEPYYPVPSQRNIELYEEYKKLSMQEKNVFFAGRLATYKYFNMDQAIGQALEFYKHYHDKTIPAGTR
jgi:UDP-galactopyranose mutase